MKKILSFILLCVSIQLVAQPDTEVHLVDLENIDGRIQLSNPRNISNNQGYDNQPSFYDENALMFASTRDGQTDILKFNIAEGSTSQWLTDTPTGGEYSPLRIPEKNTFSAIRLDIDGLQRLYEYNPDDGSSEVLVEGAKIGYHVWYTPDILVATLLVDGRMDLIVCHLADGGKFKTVQKNVGRSLLNIPNSELVSFVSKENPKEWQLKSLHPITGATETIVAIQGTEDFCWLPNGTIVAGKKNALYKLQPKRDKEWRLLQNFSDKNINNITRLAVNTQGTRLAFVAEPSPETVIQRQVEAYNARNLAAFAACYADDVVVRNFPDKVLYTGNETLKNNYKRYYDSQPNTSVEVIKRIRIGNVVIDEEMATDGGQKHQQVAIYEVNNGLISSMTFIHPNAPYPLAQEIVDQQLDAYNSRDIDGFVATYAEDIQLYQYPAKQTSAGHEALRDGYTGFFEQTPDLNCAIKKRITIGNRVIDEEYITANGNHFSAVAIYEVENGKISKVTFVQ